MKTGSRELEAGSWTDATRAKDQWQGTWRDLKLILGEPKLKNSNPISGFMSFGYFEGEAVRAGSEAGSWKMGILYLLSSIFYLPSSIFDSM